MRASDLKVKPGSVHHLAVKVVDLPRAEAFYVGVLGLEVLRRWPSHDARNERTKERSIWLDLGAGAFLALEVAGEAGGELGKDKAEGAPGFHLVALSIARADRGDWLYRLTQAGHPVYEQTDYTLYVRDPEGNRVGLSHWPEAADPRR